MIWDFEVWTRECFGPKNYQEGRGGVIAYKFDINTTKKHQKNTWHKITDLKIMHRVDLCKEKYIISHKLIMYQTK